MKTNTDQVNSSTHPPLSGVVTDPDNGAVTDIEHNDGPETYIQGPRLWFITTALCMILFLSNMEIPITTTALLSISTALDSFEKASWISTAYLLGYSGFILIIAKVSDLLGRKPMLIFTTLMFAVWSGACGAAQTMDELIVFRALQGLGGCGDFALCSVIILDLVPSHKYADYNSRISVVYALSLAVGPLIGGAITERSTWRWIFLFNVPAAVLVLIVLICALPNGFPHHQKPQKERPNSTSIFSSSFRERLDFGGLCLILISVTLFVAALEEAEVLYPWRSPYVITLLVVSGLGWTTFFLWERHLSLHSKLKEPMFPWRFATSRDIMGLFLSAVFLGATWLTCVFQLPQRLQVINGLSPIGAGVRFIPFTLAAPIGSVLTGILAKGARFPIIYMVLCAAVLQVIGLALLSTLSASHDISSAQYGYQVLAGFGCGTNISLLTLLTPFCVQDRDKAVAMGSVVQYRVLGGAVGLAICTAAFNGLTRRNLAGLLSSDQVDYLLKDPSSLKLLPETLQGPVRAVLANGYNTQLKILAGLAAAQIPSALLLWRKPQIQAV